MKNRNALGRASIVLAIIFLAWYGITEIVGAFAVAENVIYSFGHKMADMALMLIARDALNLFHVTIFVICLIMVLAGKTDFKLIIRLCIIFYALTLIDYFVVFLVLNEGNTIWGLIKDHYVDAVVLLAWIILAFGVDKMPNKVVFATTRIGVAVASVTDSAYFTLREYYGSAYEEARMERMLDVSYRLGYMFMWVIMLVIFVVFICWPHLFNKDEKKEQKVIDTKDGGNENE